MGVLSNIDLVFCVDLTSSMQGFIMSAKRSIRAVLEALAAKLEGGLRVAIVGYRDHCDGDKLLEIYPLDADIARASMSIHMLEVSGGGDAPEAVYSGLEACLGLAWAPGSYRVVILVGDAPPHGVGAPGDSLAHGDPTGLSLDDMANKLESEGVFVHALSMCPKDTVLASSFRRLSISTGGGYHETSSDAAISIVETVTQSLLADIELDTKLLARLREGVDIPKPASDDDIVPSREDIIAKMLRVDVHDIHAGMMRLRRRRLLDALDA
jgi:hypothetical protein